MIKPLKTQLVYPSPYKTVRLGISSSVEGLVLGCQPNSSVLSVGGKASKPGQVILEVNGDKLPISLNKNDGVQVIAKALAEKNYSVKPTENKKTGITELHLRRSLVSPAR